VAKLDEKKVGKDEYLLAAISELRQEVQSLSKTVRGKDEYTNKLAELLRSPSATSIMSEEEFLLQALARRKGGASLSDLTDPNSPEFRALVDEYLEKHVPPNISAKPRHVHTTFQNFLKTVRNLEKG